MHDFERLAEQGFIRIPRLVEKSKLEEFEDTMSWLAVAGLSMKGHSPGDEEPMSALLKCGGEYRVRLFANLKNLKVVQEMGSEVSQRLQDEGFLDWADLSVPAVYPTLRADPPGEIKYLLPYHQDYATPCQRAWRVWVPLRDANERSGTMKVVPKTHKNGLIEHDTSDPAHPTVPPSLFGGTTPEVIELSAGDGLIIDPLLVHASVPATENRMKYVLMVQVQDIATLGDFDNPDDPIRQRLDMVKSREHYRK